MKAQIKNLQYIEYANNFEILFSYLKKENIDLELAKKALIQIANYTNTLEFNDATFEKLYNQMRQDKVRAVMRSRKAEEKIQQLEKELKKYKLKEELGL